MVGSNQYSHDKCEENPEKKDDIRDQSEATQPEWAMRYVFAASDEKKCDGNRVR